MVNDRKKLRLVHTSDLHLGIDLYPEGAMAGLDAVLALSDERKADVVLIVGDLFDDFRVPDGTVRLVKDRLEGTGKPVIILPGNHDTVLTRGRWPAGRHSNVTVLTQAAGESVEFADLGLTVWGRPVNDHSPQFRPLEGLPPRPENGWFVSMAHGLFVDSHQDAHRSSPVTPEEIARAACDYIALGHVHVFRDVSQNGVPAFYSGAPSGYQARTVALVDMVPDEGVTVSPLPVA